MRCKIRENDNFNQNLYYRDSTVDYIMDYFRDYIVNCLRDYGMDCFRDYNIERNKPILI